MLGRNERARPVYRMHIDVDAVDLADPRPNAEAVLIAVDEVRECFGGPVCRMTISGLDENGNHVSEVLVLGPGDTTVTSVNRYSRLTGPRRVPRFATPEEIDRALERAQPKESK